MQLLQEEVMPRRFFALPKPNFDGLNFITNVAQWGSEPLWKLYINPPPPGNKSLAACPKMVTAAAAAAVVVVGVASTHRILLAVVHDELVRYSKKFENVDQPFPEDDGPYCVSRDEVMNVGEKLF